MHDDTERMGTGPVVTNPRALRWMLALYLVTAVVVALQRTLAPPPENNILIFRAAFHHLIAGRDLYAAYPAQYSDHFKYSPTFALLFAPFALLPLVPAYVLWASTCATTVFLGLRANLPPRQATLALAIAWLAVLGDLQRAQANALCAGLMLLGWAAMERRRQWPAAAAVATATFVKIFPIAALAGAIFHPRKWRFAIVAATTAVIGIALPLVAVHWGSLVAQYHSWAAIERHDAVPLSRYGASGAGLYAGLMGQFIVWFGVDWPFWPTQLAGVLILLAPLLRGRSAWTPQFRLTFLTSILVFCVLFNHQAESPTYSIAMIGAAIWYAASDRSWWRTALIGLCVVVIELGSTPLLPDALYRAYYVKYLLKTVPLIPLWLVMQGELFGLIGSRKASDVPEVGQHHAPPPEPVD